MTGIGYDKQRARWTARRTVDGKRVLVGRYRTEQEAIEALLAFDRNEEVNSFVSLKALIETEPTRDWRSFSQSLFSRLTNRFKRRA